MKLFPVQAEGGKINSEKDTKPCMHVYESVVCVCVCVCVRERERERERVKWLNLKILTLHEELHGRLRSNGQSHPWEEEYLIKYTQK